VGKEQIRALEEKEIFRDAFQIIDEIQAIADRILAGLDE
jgi:hypothetical protein